MTKICTSVEQSKKLMELGINVNTADMFYRDNGVDVKLMWEHLPDVQVTNPAWSLSALLEFMPNFTLNGFGNGQFNCRDERADCYALLDTCPLDAAFEMVCWLKENKKI